MTDAAGIRDLALALSRSALAVVFAFGVAAAAIAGCGKSDRASSAAGSAAAAPLALDVAAVNALVPAALKAQLVFERREIAVERGGHTATYTLAAPAGWTQSSKLFAHLRPAGGSPQGPRLQVGDNCDGPCAPRAWEPVVDRVNFAPHAKATVLKDEHVAGRRSMIAETPGGAIVVVAWWNDADRSYHACTATLDAALAPAAAAFDRACQSVAITGEE